MDFSLDILRKHFTEKGYLQIPFETPSGAVHETVEAFFRFLMLPDEEKQKWGFRKKFDENDNHDRGSDLGYHFRRSEMGHGYDDKEYLHYNPETRRSFLNRPNPPPELRAVLDAADVVFQSIHAAMQPIAATINTYCQQPLIDLDCPFSVLRILKYDQARPGAFLASGHYDRNVCSLAIAESAPGLRIGPHPEQLEEVRHEKGRAILFPGLMLEDKTHREFRASWHDVVQKSEDAYRENAARWAMVFFACPNAASPYWNKDLTRTKRL